MYNKGVISKEKEIHWICSQIFEKKKNMAYYSMSKGFYLMRKSVEHFLKTKCTMSTLKFIYGIWQFICQNWYL